MAKLIEQLKSEVALHRQRLKEAERRLEAAQAEASGIVVGDIVLVGPRRDQQEIVRRVEPRSWGVVLHTACRVKSGEWGNRTRAQYEWKRP